MCWLQYNAVTYGMIWSAIVLSGMLFGIRGIFQSLPQALGCSFNVCCSSQILTFSFHNSLPLIFVQKSWFKSVLSFNGSRLWNIPSFSLVAAVSHRKKNYWLYGETWIAFFPKLTDGLKIPLIEAVLPLSTYQLVILEKGLVWGNLKPTTTHNYAPNWKPEIQHTAFSSPFALIQKRWRDHLTEQES